MTQQRPTIADETIAPSLIVWEGEIPQLKMSVRFAREATAQWRELARRQVTQTTIDAVRAVLERTDQGIHDCSVSFSRFIYRNPWLGPAAIVTGAAVIVTSKSLRRWGLVAGVRNGMITALAGAALTFPTELQHAAVNLWSTSSL